MPLSRARGITARVVTAAIGVFSFASIASAQGDCAAVLRNGTLQKFDLSSRRYFQQMLHTRFVSMSYNEAKTERAMGLSVPIAEDIMGTANYSADDFRKKQSEIRRELDLSTQDESEFDVAFSRGDPDIISAWSTCMESRRGLELRLTRASGSDVNLLLAWHNGTSEDFEARLTDNVVLPAGVEAQGNTSCLRRRTKLVVNRPCRVTLKVDPGVHINMVASSDRGSSNTAFLSRKLRLDEQSKPFDFGASCQNKITAPQYYRENSPEMEAYRARCPNRLYTWSVRVLKRPTWTVTVSDADRETGWRFSEGSQSIALQQFLSDIGGSCREEFARISNPYTFEYGFTIDHRGNGARVCAVEPVALLIKRQWVPDPS